MNWPFVLTVSPIVRRAFAAYFTAYMSGGRQFHLLAIAVQRFHLKAIALGLLVAFALDLLTGMLAFIAFGGDALQAGATPEEIRAAAEQVQQNQSYLLAVLVMGTATTALGGYVTARLARQLPLWNACAMGVAGLGTGLLVGVSGQSPLWFDAIGILATVPAAIVGGIWGRSSPGKPRL